MTKILITGSSGYIGSCLSNYLKDQKNIYLIDKVNPKKFDKKNFFFIKCDLNNTEKLEKVLRKIKPEIIIHLAAKSTVNEKIDKNKYIDNNIKATKNLIKVMLKLKINKIIFSSTAAVYDRNLKFLKEKHSLKPISNYGKSKLIAEKMIKKNKKIKYVILRFFNVSGCITNPLIGEFHNPETHLVPISVFRTIKKNFVNIFGNNYPTKDGTCIRDYVHVKDICSAIKKSIFFLKKNNSLIVNIGGGKGTSNLEVLKRLKRITNKDVKINFLDKRKGDHPFLVCNINKANTLLGWKPKFSKIDNILRDEIRWSNFLIKKNIIRKYQSVQK